jgi:hypothetical protein
VRPLHHGRVGDHHRAARLLAAAGHLLGRDLGPGVRTDPSADRRPGGQHRASDRHEHPHTRHVHDRVQPAALRGLQDHCGAGRIGLLHDRAPARIQREHRGGVHHRVAAKHRLPDRRSAGHVPDYGVAPGDPQRIKGGRDPVTSPDQQPDLVALPGQRGYRVAADISGPTGDQHPHRQLPPAAGAEHTAVRPGGKAPARANPNGRPYPRPGRQDQPSQPGPLGVQQFSIHGHHS